MLKLANRVKETSISTGTGSVILRGGFSAFQTFSSAIGNSNSTFYTIENETRWEVGIGTYTSATNSLSRDTVLSSSNSGSKIDLNGVSIVFCTLPAEKTVFFGDNNYLPEGKPLTLTRESAGNFIHAFVDNSSDETVALHMQDSSDPTWKFGLKNTPNSKTTAPQYGYVYGSNGTAGLYGDSDAYAYMDSNLGFYIVHESSNLVQVTKDGGTEIKNGSANVNALTVKGAAAQSYPLQVWTNNAGTTLSSVSSDGSLALGKSGGANYTLDVDGTANVTTLRFSDGSSQTTASKSSGEFVGLSGAVETNKTNVATNTAQIAINKATTVDVSGLLTGPYSAASGTLINTHFMPLVSGQVVMPISSGDVINTMLAAIDQGGGGGGDGLPTSSGALINAHFLPKSSGNAIYLPTSSGANIAANFMPLFSGIAINTFFATKQDEITASNRIDSAHIAGGNVSNTEFGFLNGVTDDIQTQLDGKIPTSSGAAINAHFMPMVSGDAKYIPISSGAAINAHFMPMVSGDVKYLPVASGDVINDAFVDIVDSATPSAGSGLLKIGNTFHAVSGSIITSGVVMLTNDVSSNLTPSGKAVTPQGVINYSIPATSGDVINTALVNVLGGSIPKDSGYLPIDSGAVINDAFVDIVNSVSPPSAGSGLIKIGNTFHGASGSIITSGVVRLTNDVTSNPTPSGLAVTPQGVINYAIPATSGAVINATFVDIVDGAMPASSGHDVLHSAGLGLLKSGGHVYAASGSIVASGSLMLTNDVASNPTPSGKAVTPQGVINYVDALTLDEDNMASDSATSLATQQSIKAYVDANAGSVTVGLGLSKVGSNVFGASGSIVSSGSVMLTNDITSNPTPSGKAVTPQGVINYALPVTSGAVINDAFVDIVDGAMPASSGHDVLHSVGLGLTKSGGHVYAASGSIVSSGSVMLTNDVTENLSPSGKAVTTQGVINYALPATSGAVINTLIGAIGASGSLTTYALPATSGDVINTMLAAASVVNASGSLFTYAAPSSIHLIAGDGLTGGGNISANRTFAVNVDDSTIETNSDEIRVKDAGITLAKMANLANMKAIGNTTGGAATPAAVSILDEDNMASDSATSLATQQSIKAYVDANSGSVTVGLGLSKVGSNVFGASGSIVSSGSLMLTNDVSSNPTPSGKAVTPQGVINYAEPIISASNRVPANLIHDGSISNTEFGFLEGIGDNIQGQLNDKVQIAGSGLIKIGTTMHAASGSIITSGVVRLTNDVTSNARPSGLAVTPQGVVNYAFPATSGHDVLHSVGLGLLKSGGHIYATSGSIVASGAVMLTNDVHENLAPSGKAVTTQGVINYITENANLKVGRDSENLIDFATTDNKIILRANDINQVSLIDNVFGPETDSDVDLGTSAKRWKDAYVDSITVTGEVDGASLDISGDADIDGTTNLDAVDIDGNVQIDGTVTVGVNDTGKDVKFFGASDGKYMLWDESADKLDVIGTVGISGALTLDASLNQDPAIQTGANDAIAIDCGLSNYHEITIDNTVNSLVFTNVTVGQRIVLKVTNHSTHKDMDANDGWDTITVNGGSKTAIWPGGTVPTLTEANNAVDVYGILFDSSLVPNCFIIGQHLQ
jgi:non-canonical (house-cleaning) NTP pyrophosphatase